jgi:hypothetical protein
MLSDDNSKEEWRGERTYMDKFHKAQRCNYRCKGDCVSISIVSYGIKASLVYSVLLHCFDGW